MSSVFEWREAPAADFAVIGDPITHSRSPKMHNGAYARMGLPYRYVAIHVPSGEVAPALDHLASIGYRGVNVTVPHKIEAMGWCCKVTDIAGQVGAVNTIRLAERTGTNTDFEGTIAALRELGFTTFPSLERPILIAGAGGAGRMVAAALLNLGAADVRLFNRTPERASEVAQSLGPKIRAVSEIDLEGVALLINATSASLRHESLPIAWKKTERDLVAWDLAYADGPTTFMGDAVSHGVPAFDGRTMLIGQAVAAVEFWGFSVEESAMREALESKS